MDSLDTVSIGILLGALLVLAGILSNLVALRFGAPLLLVFLLVGMAAGESGPLAIHFNDVETAYTIGSVALGLILFDGGLRTRFQTIRSVIWPAGLLATVGVIRSGGRMPKMASARYDADRPSSVLKSDGHSAAALSKHSMACSKPSRVRRA